MRIVNVTTAPKYFSYVGAGGRWLQAAHYSIDLPIETLLNPTLWLDIDANHCKLRLSATDLALVARIQAAHSDPIVLNQEP